MKVHLLSGFLGSGKTTAIRQAISVLMKQGIRAGVITNDQGIQLVDGNFFKSLSIPSRQVVNGCFCCNYNDLNSSIESLIATSQADVIFAESVGSCTDIVATVMKPLLRYRPGTEVTVSAFADARLLHMLLSGNSASFDESVTYIYHKQLEEAGIIIINKIDLMNAGDLEDLKGMLHEVYGNKTLVFQNSLDAGSVSQWLQALTDASPNERLPSLDIDYDVYGAGEAMLAWLDEEIEISGSTHSAVADIYDLINLIYKKITEKHFAIGHLKFLLNDTVKISFTSTTQQTTDAGTESHPSPSASLLVNARVQTTPEMLSKIVADSIEEISKASGCTIVVHTISAFQPGYPRPTYRY